MQTFRLIERLLAPRSTANVCLQSTLFTLIPIVTKSIRKIEHSSHFQDKRKTATVTETETADGKSGMFAVCEKKPKRDAISLILKTLRLVFQDLFPCSQITGMFYDSIIICGLGFFICGIYGKRDRTCI